ncbi:MAG TPA: L,D-transpeptidase/peptidoglycan binding protein [Gaiellaceae bacterium]
MRRRILVIGIGVVVLVLAAGAGGLYAYDSSRSNLIAEGVTVAGIDVGGLNASSAREVLRRSLAPGVGKDVVVEWQNRRWTLRARAAGVRLDVARMVREALARSHRGGLLQRVLRDLSGAKVHAQLPARVAFSRGALYRFVDDIAAQIDRQPTDASINPSGVALNVVPSRDGLAVRRRWLALRILRQLRDPASIHVALVPTLKLRPKLSTAQLAVKYQTFITIDRPGFTLRLWKSLRLVHSYTIAVGRQGLETPAGLYQIDDKQVNPSWHVPNSAWAGALAGRVIPPGPQDPIKARWMGFYNGAGIHGTDELSSLGTAASHGCIRMSIPDVLQLYPLVPLHTPIYVG